MLTIYALMLDPGARARDEWHTNKPDFHPSRPHEAIVQYYTFKLLETIGDKKLAQAFSTLKQGCTDVYRAWRAIERYTLEEMRNILVEYSKRRAEGPPSF